MVAQGRHKTCRYTTEILEEPIVEALLNDTGTLDFDPKESQLFIATLRRLTKGQPVSPEEVAQIAAEFDLSGQEANAALNKVA